MASAVKISAHSADYGYPSEALQCPLPGIDLTHLRRGPQSAVTAYPQKPVGGPRESPQAPDRRSMVKQLMLADKDDACNILTIHDLADRFSALTGRSVSPAILEKLYKPSVAVKNLAVADLPAWAATTGSVRVLRWAAAECGYSLATDEDRAYAELGRVVAEIHEREQRVRRLMEEIAA